MSTLTQTLKRNAYGAVAVLITLSALLPSLLLASSASAAQVTARKIEMSSSAPAATGVSYSLSFNPGTNGTVEAIVIDFCNAATGPIIGTACTNPTSMTVGTTITTLTNDGADVSSGWTAGAVTSGDGIYVHKSGGLAGDTGDQIVVTLSGFVNPNTTGTFYARILTYATEAGGLAYQSGTPGTHIDDGGIALSTAAQLNVTAAVQEQLTFCVSGSNVPADGCSGTNAPNLSLGDGSPPVLSTDEVDTATANIQVSTNASGSTVVKMRNSAASGGLNSGSNSIAPAGSLRAIGAGEAYFGMNNQDGAGDELTVLEADIAYEHTTSYAMITGAGGVDSTYGDTIASATGPLSNANMALVFGARANNITPAGVYTAVLSLIATSSY